MRRPPTNSQRNLVGDESSSRCRAQGNYFIGITQRQGGLQASLRMTRYQNDIGCSTMSNKSFSPSVGVKTRVARGFDRDARRMAFHDSVEHAPQSSRVIRMGHEHNRSKLMLVAPLGKRLNFLFGSFDGRDSHDIRHTKRPQLANLGCPPSS